MTKNKSADRNREGSRTPGSAEGERDPAEQSDNDESIVNQADEDQDEDEYEEDEGDEADEGDEDETT